MSQPLLVDSTFLVVEVKHHLIQSAKQSAAIAINTELTLLYWQLGKRLANKALKGERAEYAQYIIRNLAFDLSTAFGKGRNKKQLHHCLRFIEVFPGLDIVSALRRQLSWTHFKNLIYLDNPLRQSAG